MEAIYGKKGIKAGNVAGNSKDIVLSVARDLIQKGAESIICGCSDISLVLAQRDINVPLVDALSILAEAVVARAGLTPISV